MTKEEILQEQIDAMEKLLKLKQAIIEDLEKRIDKLEHSPYNQNPFIVPNWAPPAVNLPSVWTTPNTCPNGGHHEYPGMWGGTQNPPCNKCGQTMPNPFGAAGGLAGGSGTTI